jgi:hypothetical protein
MSCEIEHGSDGATFTVVLEHAGADEETLFERTLVPCPGRELVFVGSHRRAWQGAPTQADWAICGGGATPPGAARALKTHALFRDTALDPKRDRVIRPPQTLELRFETQEHARLLLETGPGPSGNAADDWTFWTRSPKESPIASSCTRAT